MNTLQKLVTSAPRSLQWFSQGLNIQDFLIVGADAEDQTEPISDDAHELIEFLLKKAFPLKECPVIEMFWTKRFNLCCARDLQVV